MRIIRIKFIITKIMIRLESKKKFEPRSFSLSVSHEKFDPSFLEAGITIDIETWKRKYTATELSFRAAVALGLELFEEGDVRVESSELAVRSLGVNQFDKLMTAPEGKATAVLDEAARQVIAKEPTLTLPQLYKIFAQYRQGLSLGDEHIQELLANIDIDELSEAKFSTSDDMEILLEIGGKTLIVAPESYVSMLVADLFARAREGRSIFDKNNISPVSKVASKLRSELNIGLLTQRSSDVIEKIKFEKKDSLPADILALLETQHGVGFHGTGEERFFVKMADGTVVEQTRMKECDGCAHGAEETIKNNAPEMPISEMVQEFEARQVELKPEQIVVVEDTVLPPFYGIPLISRESLWSSPSISKAAKEVSATASEPASPTPSRSKTAGKPRAAQTGARPVNRQISSNEGVHNEHAPSPKAEAMTANRSARKSKAPRIEIVTLSSGQTAVVSGVERLKPAGSRPKETRNIGSAKKVKVSEGQRKPQRRIFDTVPPKVNAPMLASRLSRALSDAPSFTRPQGQRGEGPSALNIPKGQVDSTTVRQAARRVTGTTLQQAIAWVETAKVIEKTAQSSSTERVIAEKIETTSAGRQKSLIVNSAANAVIHNGQQATPAAQPKQGKVNKTQSKAIKKRKLRSSNMALQLALPSSSHDIDVLNPMSARRMVYASLPLVA